MRARQFHPDKSFPAEPGFIWVFGSNLAGVHGAGAALVAKMHFEAQTGVGRGPTGRSYAVPTKDERLQTLPFDRVRAEVARFLEYAQAHPELKFYVTRVGCGLAGYQDEKVAPLFKSAPANCSLPVPWGPFTSGDAPSSDEQPSRFEALKHKP